MNRAQKEEFISGMTQDIREAQAFALMSFNKITVEQMTSFRLSLRKRNVYVKVLKNTLAKRVLADTPYKDISGKLEGPTLIAVGKADPVVTAKVIWEWVNRENFDLKVKASVALGKLVSEAQFKALSQLPGRNELLVGFLWALKLSPTKFLYALSDPPRRMAYALAALKAKKTKEPTEA